MQMLLSVLSDATGCIGSQSAFPVMRIKWNCTSIFQHHYFSLQYCGSSDYVIILLY